MVGFRSAEVEVHVAAISVPQRRGMSITNFGGRASYPKTIVGRDSSFWGSSPYPSNWFL